MRPFLLVVLPWLLGCATVVLVLGIENAAAKKRAAYEAGTGDDIVVPIKPPSFLVFAAVSLLCGFLVLPVFFWFSRRTFVGVLLGIGAAVLAIGVAGTAEKIDERIVARAELSDRAARCDSSTPVILGCHLVATAFDTGTACINRAVDLDDCPAGFSISVGRDPDRARRIYEKACFGDVPEHEACRALRNREGVAPATRVKAEAKYKELCDSPLSRGLCRE